MLFTQLDRTDLRLSRIGFGTASLHHLVPRSRRLALLDGAFAAGITHFDTSPYYGYGLAEHDLGIFLKGRRERVTIATKVGLYPSGSASRSAVSVWLRKAAGKLDFSLSLPHVDWRVETAEASLNASLRRLKTDYVDILFLHEPNRDLIDAELFLSWLEAVRAKGKIRNWGLAGLPACLEPWMVHRHPLSSILQCKDSLAGHDADVIPRHGRKLQVTYGYLSDVRNEGTRQSAVDVLRHALNRNTEGTILVSSRRLRHLEELATAVT